jgi:hypothetical protein
MTRNFAVVLTLGIASFGLVGFAPAQPSDPLEPAPPVSPSQPSGPALDEPSTPSREDRAIGNVAATVARTHPEVPQVALQRAIQYVQDHSASVSNKDYVTIIDFNKASTQKRMFVINLSSAKVDSYLVAHGLNSGDNYASKFSNTEGTKKSSVGIYVTANEYEGEHGRSMRLQGKDPSNSNANSRDIVMHGADYVSQDFADEHGRLGRSWGCPAVEMRYKDELVKKLEEGSVLYIYHSSFCSSTTCHL